MGVAAVLLGLLGCGDDGSGPPVVETGSIGGQVQADGAGIGNLNVALTGDASRSTRTSSNGTFSFAALAPGGYTVTIEVPSGMQMAGGEQSSRSVTVQAGQSSTLEFHLVTLIVVPPGTVDGTVLSGGSGVSGATLTLKGPGFSRTTTTAATGGYTLLEVPEGEYSLELTVPSGYAMAPGQQSFRAVSVVSQQTTTVNFTLIPAPSAARR